MCGEPLPAGDLVLPGEPMLTVVTCKYCGRKIEVKKDEATGETITRVAMPA